nr:rhodanese-like domain-containing protein [uncultured Haemophilus sp.]
MDLTFTQQLQQFIANHPLLIAAWVAVFVITLYTLYKGATSKFKVIENADAVQLVNNEDGVFLDVRSDDEFRKGHIVESHSVHPTDIKESKTTSIDKFKDRPVIVVDTNGFNASKIAEQLVKHGFEKVYVLKEGIVGWKAANLPTVKK